MRTPVDVSLWVSAYASTPASARGSGWVPGAEAITDGSLSHGARVVTDANLAENSPNDRCCDRSAISPNAAASQNAVVPPLPRATKLPFGRPKSSVRPRRIRRTTSRTGACRCDVPSSGAAARAAACSGRTLVGPLPNRPSRGLSLSGMTMLVTQPGYATGPP